MTPAVFTLTAIGAGYASWTLMRFILWLDTPKGSADTAREV